MPPQRKERKGQAGKWLHEKGGKVPRIVKQFKANKFEAVMWCDKVMVTKKLKGIDGGQPANETGNDKTVDHFRNFFHMPLFVPL